MTAVQVDGESDQPEGALTLMRPRFGAAITALALAGAFAGCGDDGGGESLTLGAYAQAYVSVYQTYEGQVGPLRQSLEAAFADLSADDPVPTDVIDTFQEILDRDADFAAEISDLNPPAEAENLHDEAVDALRSAHDAIQDVLDGVDETITVAELNDRLTAQDVVDAGRRRFDACIAVQEVANEQGVSVDLAC